MIANLFGTTGAAMLLIRPYLRMNQKHLKPYHIVFFIFIVANVGGCLTPIGDPPLFIGYLMGVPFWWVFENMHGVWMLVVGALLMVFFILDTVDHRAARKPPSSKRRRTGRGNSSASTIFSSFLPWIAAVFQPRGFFTLLHQPFGIPLIAKMAQRRGKS